MCQPSWGFYSSKEPYKNLIFVRACVWVIYTQSRMMESDFLETKYKESQTSNDVTIIPNMRCT